MAAASQVNRSISTIQTELQYLASINVLAPQQLQSILAQLPQNGQPSSYVDMNGSSEKSGPAFSQVAHDAQDPNHPAHPSNPKHHEWASKMAGKFGNAMMFGAGATFGGDMIDDALKHV